MKHFLAVGSSVLVLSSLSVSAQTNASPASPVAGASPTVTAPSAPVHPRPILFHPTGDLTSGIQPLRVGGGSRGGAADDLSIEVLVPDQMALTTQAQPTLYWYQSKAAKTQCEVTVTEPKNPKPLLLLKSAAPTPAGIHAIRLTKFNVKLKPNIVYRWSVAVVTDPQNRSQDIVADGVVKRIEPSPDLAGQLGQAAESDKAAIYAENGIWYDALQSISDQIDHAPQDESLRRERADLLKQVGMDGANMDGILSQSP
jgi:hypothetical protein